MSRLSVLACVALALVVAALAFWRARARRGAAPLEVWVFVGRPGAAPARSAAAVRISAPALPAPACDADQRETP